MRREDLDVYEGGGSPSGPPPVGPVGRVTNEVLRLVQVVDALCTRVEALEARTAPKRSWTETALLAGILVALVVGLAKCSPAPVTAATYASELQACVYYARSPEASKECRCEVSTRYDRPCDP